MMGVFVDDADQVAYRQMESSNNVNTKDDVWKSDQK